MEKEKKFVLSSFLRIPDPSLLGDPHSLKLSFTSWDRGMDTLSHLGDCSGRILYKMEGHWAMTLKEWAPVTSYWSAQKDDYRLGILLIYYCGSMEYKRGEWGEAVMLLFLLSLTLHCWCFFKNLICLILAALSLHCCARPFSSCGEPRLLPHCGARASHCGGVSGCRAWALEDAGFSSCGSQALELGIKSCGTRD